MDRVRKWLYERFDPAIAGLTDERPPCDGEHVHGYFDENGMAHFAPIPREDQE